MCAGISYNDFWQMTFGEVEDVLTFARDREEAKADADIKSAAFTAYFSGAYARPGVRLPQSLVRAFPDLFGRTADGGIKAENWQESKRAMMMLADNFNASKKRR